MILVVFVGLSAALVPLARGRLLNLASLRFRRPWLLLVAMAMQADLILVHGPRTPLRNATYIASFIVAAAFLFENRRIPGVWLIGLGAGMNLAAIAANGGVMPASPHALGVAGLPTGTSLTYINSMALHSARLAFLGDIFAIPKSLPLSNVFSAGDICVALGAAVAIHRISGSMLVPSGRGQFSPLLRRPLFMRLWAAQGISNLGDWTYALAVATVLVHRTHSPQALALLLVAQVGPAALFSGLFSALPDRHSRTRLMIGSDLVSAAAVGSLLIGHPSIAHIYVVAAMLGTFGALFQPSVRACMPSVVEKDQIVAANAMIGSTYNFAVMAGPAIGGVLVYALGPTPVFAINAMSFLLSASLIAGIRLPPPTLTQDRRRSAIRDVMDGAKYSLSTPLVRGLLIVIGIVLVAAASKAPLESLFVLGTLSLGPQALGLVMGSWGVGMVLGSVAAPAVCRRWPREKVLALMILVVAACVFAAAQAHDLETVLLAWLAAGSANSIANVSYESVLQEQTPDRMRGRVFAAFGVVRNVAFLAGAFLAGWLGSHIGVRMSYVFSGGLFITGAIVARVMLPATRKSPVSAALNEAWDPDDVDVPARTRRVARKHVVTLSGDEALYRFRLRVFALVRELGSVRAACRASGITPSTYYRWRREVRAFGPGILRPRDGDHSITARATSQLVDQRVLAFALGHPELGPGRISADLRESGVELSPSGVWKILRRHGLSTKAERLGAGDAPSQPSTRRERDRHLQASRPGQIVEFDCFSIGKLPDSKGAAWQYTALDVASGYCWAEIHLTPRRPSARWTSRLARRVARDLADRGWRLESAMTHNTSAFRSEEFDGVLTQLEARHVLMPAGRPETNGMVVRMHDTILEECWKPAFERFPINKFNWLRVDLERYLRHYNTERPHTGLRTNGRTPDEILRRARPARGRALVASRPEATAPSDELVLVAGTTPGRDLA